ncbi:MAG: hypothetical protein RPR97_15930 [Colwellia sp.]
MTKLTKDQKRKLKLKLRQKKLIAKQQANANNGSGTEVIRFTPELLSLFEKLPEPNEEFECVPLIRQFYEMEIQILGKQVNDIEYAVASTFVMYGHWYTSGSNALAISELETMSDVIVNRPKFLTQLNKVAA